MSHQAPQTTIDEIKLREFFQDYSLEGDETIANIAHPGFKFVRDGWAAAVAVCNTYGHEVTREASHVADLLLMKTVHLDDMTLEQFAVAERRGGTSKAEHLRFVVASAREFWREVCRRDPNDAENPAEVVRPRTARDPWNSRPIPQRAEVRFHQPFPYPIPQTSEKSLFGFVRLLDEQFVPKSAIFFAVRFRTLLQLAGGMQHFEPGSTQEKHGLMEIHSVLLCMLAYYIGIEGAKDAPFNGQFDLEFNRHAWLDTYFRCGKRGSHVLGPEGYQLHRDFLVSHRGDLGRWCEGAVQWWISEDSDMKTQKRQWLTTQLAKMMKHLYDIMGITRYSPHHPIARSHIS